MEKSARLYLNGLKKKEVKETKFHIHIFKKLTAIAFPELDSAWAPQPQATYYKGKHSQEFDLPRLRAPILKKQQPVNWNHSAQSMVESPLRAKRSFKALQRPVYRRIPGAERWIREDKRGVLFLGVLWLGCRCDRLS